MWFWLASAFGKFSAAAAKESSLGEERQEISLANPSVFVYLCMFLYFVVVLGTVIPSAFCLVRYAAFRCTGRPGGFCHEGLWGFSRCPGSDGTDAISVGRSVVPVVETCRKLQIFKWSHCVLHFDLGKYGLILNWTISEWARNLD